MTMALEIFNTIFTTVFLIEFVLKFTGYGFYGYIKNAFNVFDGIVVIISIIELAGSRAGGVSVLRTFRLMRIFKLIRFLPTLQKQIQVNFLIFTNNLTSDVKLIPSRVPHNVDLGRFNLMTKPMNDIW